MSHLLLPSWDELPSISLYMDQVVSIIEDAMASLPSDDARTVTPTMINNYVKQRVLPPPVKKRYERGHVAALLVICTLKRVLSMREITALLAVLTQDGTAKEGYLLFRDELDLAVQSAFDGRAPSDVPCELPVLRAACTALAYNLLTERLLLDTQEVVSE